MKPAIYKKLQKKNKCQKQWNNAILRSGMICSNKRTREPSQGRAAERERRARCSFAPSYAYHSVPWSQMLYHCWKPSWNAVVLAFLNQKNLQTQPPCSPIEIQCGQTKGGEKDEATLRLLSKNMRMRSDPVGKLPLQGTTRPVFFLSFSPFLLLSDKYLCCATAR